MKIQKRVLLLLVTCILAIGTIVGASSVSAATWKKYQRFSAGNYNYKVLTVNAKKKSGTVMLIGVVTSAKNKTKVTVPEKVKKGGYTWLVTALGTNAFKGCKKLKTVVTNKSLKTIQKNTFNGCSKLATINITGTKLTKVENNALSGIKKNAVVNVANNAQKSLIANKGQTVKIQTTAAAAATATPTPTPKPAEKPAAVVKPTATPTPKPVKKPAAAAVQESNTAAKPTATPTPKPAKKPASNAKPTPTSTPKPVKKPASAAVQAPHEHVFSSWKEVRPATCTEQGEKKAECSCGEIKTQVIPALGHSYGPYTYNEDATCTADGTESADCTRCGEKDTRTKANTKLEHVPVYHEEVAATCLEPGRTAYETCEICGAEITSPQTIEKTGHVFSPWELTSPATCGTLGVETQTCTVCGEKQTRTTTTVGDHVFGDWNVKTEATCAHPGSEERVCSVCGQKEHKTIKALEHTLVKGEAVPPTCTERGKQYSNCSVCGQVFFRYTDMPLGHDYRYENVPATCKEPAQRVGVCARCRDRVSENTAPALGHDYQYQEIAATCTQPGYKGEICTRCQDKKNVVKTRATGHVFEGEYITEVPATCTAQGSMYRECIHDGCTVREKKSIPALGHQYGGYVVIQEGNCVLDKVERKTCERAGCGATEDKRTKCPGAHVFTTKEVKREPTCTARGYEVDTCEVCGYKKYVELVEQHNFGPIEVHEAKGICGTKITYQRCLNEGCMYNRNYSYKGYYGNTVTGGFDYIISVESSGHQHTWVDREDIHWGDEVYAQAFGSGSYTDFHTAECSVCGRTYQPRLVWYVTYKANLDRCVGFQDSKGNYVNTLIKNTINDGYRSSEGRTEENYIMMNAPAAKPGYHFVGWKNVATGKMDHIAGASRVDTWKNMDMIFEAVYEPGDASAQAINADLSAEISIDADVSFSDAGVQEDAADMFDDAN